jgi:4-hydroxybenzoate polyprenyltransferase
MNPIVKILSRRNWGILRYNSVFQNLTALFYIAYISRRWTMVFIADTILFFIFSVLMTGYGYLMNDLADIDLDRRHGKPNAFTNMKRSYAISILVAVLICGAVFSVPFLKNVWFTVFWAIWIMTATAYSLPPLRFKEHGALGLATTVLAQQALPLVLLFAAFGSHWSYGVLVFVSYASARGLSSDIGHQVRDWTWDSQTDTRTFAVEVGFERAKTIYWICLEFERLVLGVVLAVLWLEFPQLVLPSISWHIPLVLPLVLIYLILLGKTIGRSWNSWRKGLLEENDPFDEERQTRQFDALHVIHHTFPTVIIPLYLAILITIAYLPNGIFILIIVLVFNLYRPVLWLRLFPIQFISSKFQSLSYIGKKDRS